MKKISISMPEDIYTFIKNESIKENRTISNYISTIISAYKEYYIKDPKNYI